MGSILLTILLFISGFSSDRCNDKSPDLFSVILTRIDQGIYSEEERQMLDNIALDYFIQDHQEGLAVIFKVLEKAIILGLDTLRFDCHRYLGSIYSQLGMADRSLENSLLAYHFYARINERGNYNWTLINIGNTYYWEDHPEQALRFYRDALNGFEEMIAGTIPGESDSERQRATAIDGMAVSLNNIALCHTKNEDYHKAADYHYKALELRRKTDSPLLISQSYGYLGHVYSMIKQDDEALGYFHDALQLLAEAAKEENTDIALGNSILAFTYRRMGTHYGRRLNIKEAGMYFERAIEIYKKTGNDKEVINTWLSMINSYINSGNKEEALNFAYAALELATRNEYWQDKILALKNIASIYSAKGQFQNAFEYSERANETEAGLYRDYSDFVLQSVERDIANRVQLENMQALRQESIIKELNLKRQRTIIIFLIISTVLAITILLVLLHLFNTKRITNRQLKEMNSEMRRVNKRLMNSEVNLENINNELNTKNASLIKSEETLKILNSTKDKFFSILAHDLRGPVSSIMQLSELFNIKYDELSEEKKKKFLYQLQKSSKGLFELVETLLLWARSQQGTLLLKKETIELQKIIAHNIKIFDLAATNKNIKLVSSADNSTAVMADVNMVNTILRNLISNALKYSHKGGTVHIEAETGDKFAAISVVDNGVGMTPDVKENLFNINKSESNTGTEGEKGSGLGLVICKELVEQLDGTITAESGEGKGSKFTFTLPLAPGN